MHAFFFKLLTLHAHYVILTLLSDLVRQPASLILSSSVEERQTLPLVAPANLTFLVDLAEIRNV
jgi:hypothetical protein